MSEEAFAALKADIILQVLADVPLLRDGALKPSQFPSTMTDANGTFTKPAGWA